MGKALGEGLGVPHFELDSFFHGPNWQQTPDDVFRGLIQNATNVDVWVADGNYSQARDILWARATTLVWLDYPFPLVFWRLFRRTMRRGILRQELWNGNRENLWWHFFSKESLFLFLFQTYRPRRRQFAEYIALPDYAHLNVHIFRSPAETDRWLQEVIAGRL